MGYRCQRYGGVAIGGEATAGVDIEYEAGRWVDDGGALVVRKMAEVPGEGLLFTLGTCCIEHGGIDDCVLWLGCWEVASGVESVKQGSGHGEGA